MAEDESERKYQNLCDFYSWICGEYAARPAIPENPRMVPGDVWEVSVVGE
jgi:hypothetical protein